MTCLQPARALRASAPHLLCPLHNFGAEVLDVENISSTNTRSLPSLPQTGFLNIAWPSTHIHRANAALPT
jgi:hypothetical protein